MEQRQICAMVKSFVADLMALGATGDINPLLTPENVLIGEQKISLRQMALPAPQTMPMRAYPGFSAPEVYAGRSGPQTSVYFVGAVLYTLIKGAPPPDAQSRATQPGPLLTDGSPLSQLANRALSMQEYQRPVNLAALLDDLTKTEAQLSPAAPASAPLQQPAVAPAMAAPVATAGVATGVGAATAASGSAAPMQAAQPPAAPVSAQATPPAATAAPAAPVAPAQPTFGTAAAMPATAGTAPAAAPAPTQATAATPAAPAQSSTPAAPAMSGQASTMPGQAAPQATTGMPAQTPYGQYGQTRPMTTPQQSGYPGAAGMPGTMPAQRPAYGAPTGQQGYPSTAQASPYATRPVGAAPGYPGAQGYAGAQGSGMGMQPGMGMPGQMPPQKKKSKIGLWIGLGAAALVVIALGVYTLVMSSSANSSFEATEYSDVVHTMDMAPWLKVFQGERYEYSQAQMLYEEGKIEEAIEKFEALGAYEDSAELANKIKYDYAIELMEDGAYDKSLTLLGELGSYKDSAELRANLSLYMDALEMDDMAAFDAFTELGDFLDSADRAYEIAGAVYDDAMDLYLEGDFSAAKKQFDKLGDFKDADLYSEAIGIWQNVNTMTTNAELMGYRDQLEVLSDSIDVGPLLMSNELFEIFLDGSWYELLGSAWFELDLSARMFGMDYMGSAAASYQFRDQGFWTSGSAASPDYVVTFVSFDAIIITDTRTDMIYLMFRY